MRGCGGLLESCLFMLCFIISALTNVREFSGSKNSSRVLKIVRWQLFKDLTTFILQLLHFQHAKIL